MLTEGTRRPEGSAAAITSPSHVVGQKGRGHDNVTEKRQMVTDGWSCKQGRANGKRDGKRDGKCYPQLFNNKPTALMQLRSLKSPKLVRI